MARVERGGVIDSGRSYLLSQIANTATMTEEAARQTLAKLGVPVIKVGAREWVSGTAFNMALDTLSVLQEPESSPSFGFGKDAVHAAG